MSSQPGSSNPPSDPNPDGRRQDDGDVRSPKPVGRDVTVDQSGNRGGTNAFALRDIIFNPSKISWWVKAPVIIGLLTLLLAAVVAKDEILNLFDSAAHRPPAAYATIVNTGQDGATFAYPGPDNSEGSKVANGGWREGQRVGILCQVTNGRPISDPAYPGGAVTSTVWDRVQSTGGPMYIPDIYTNLPKGDDHPPNGIPAC